LVCFVFGALSFFRSSVSRTSGFLTSHSLTVGRLTSLINTHSKDVIYGGQSDEKDRYIAPTLLQNVQLDSEVCSSFVPSIRSSLPNFFLHLFISSLQVMKGEIFGPILPIIEYESLDKVITSINSSYAFSFVFLFFVLSSIFRLFNLFALW
jgi:hypothetical protein